MTKSPEFSPPEDEPKQEEESREELTEGIEELGESVEIIALCRVPDSKVLGYFLDQKSCDDFAREIKDATTGTMPVKAKKIEDKYYIEGQEIIIEK